MVALKICILQGRVRFISKVWSAATHTVLVGPHSTPVKLRTQGWTVRRDFINICMQPALQSSVVAYVA